MTIQHHLSDELLQSYAAGSLTEGWSVAVATHLALCPTCRKRLDRYECVGGHLMTAHALEPQIIETEAAKQQLDASWSAIQKRLSIDAPQAQLQTQAHTAAMLPNTNKTVPVLPEPLRSYAGGDVNNLKWRSLGRGAFQIIIPTGDKKTTVRLLKIPAGKPVPEHGHGGREVTLVLSGRFSDGDEIFGRGDIEEADADLVHQPVATPDADCICLAVTDAPLQFRSWIVRLMQPVLGI